MWQPWHHHAVMTAILYRHTVIRQLSCHLFSSQLRTSIYSPSHIHCNAIRCDNRTNLIESKLNRIPHLHKIQLLRLHFQMESMGHWTQPRLTEISRVASSRNESRWCWRGLYVHGVGILWEWYKLIYLLFSFNSKSVISSALAFCPSVTLKKKSYEGLEPPWKLSQIVEIRFFRKFPSNTKLLGPNQFSAGVLPKMTLFAKMSVRYANIFTSLTKTMVWNSRCLVWKHIYVSITSVIENIRRVQVL